MRQKWTRLNSLILVGLFVAGGALGQDDLVPVGQMADSDLTALPRTGAEAARIAAVTALATDFGRAEPFESLPAGAGTVPAQTGPRHRRG